jgi:DNA-nicking Smr family endonuclease
MARKRISKSSNKSNAAAPKRIFSSPFKELSKLLRDRPLPARIVKPPLPEPEPVTETIDEDSVLREALEGVRPLTANGARRMAPVPAFKREIVSEDAEVLARLSDLVTGQGTFDITETEEYVEGMRAGIDPRVVVRLRRGEFAIQAHLDLHGMVQEAAKTALTEFILESVRKGRRAVLIVHGRGLGSPDGRPVLKHATVQWLSHGALAAYVLAFTTARPSEGGAGAMCALLRRDRRRGLIDVLSGAKRRD